jgi:hypothetical protein
MTMLEVMAPYTTDASPSWNGYNHQGKVAIYVALKLMEEIPEGDIEKFEIELEWLEDFSMKKEGRYISIHQVKTMPDTATSSYKEATWLLLAKLLEIKELENAYLHVTQKLTNFEKFEEKLLTYTLNERETGKVKTKGKKYASPIECRDKVIGSGKYNDLFEKFDLYEYESGNYFCSLEEIEELIKARLKQIIGTGATEIRVDRAYHFLLGLIDKNIRERQIDIQSGKKVEKVSIDFLEIQKVVQHNFESVSKEYAAYFLKNEFNSISQSYLDDLQEEYQMGTISAEEILLVNKIIKQIYELGDEQFLEFCLKITPNNEVSKDHPDHIVKMIQQCLNRTGLNDGFFEITKEVKKELEENMWVYNQKNQEGINITYLPSTIIDKNHPVRNQKLAKAILNNAHPELLNEVDKIITTSINMDTLEDTRFHSNVPDPEGLEIQRSNDYHDRITKIKNISLIDLNKAKGEISN